MLCSISLIQTYALTGCLRERAFDRCLLRETLPVARLRLFRCMGVVMVEADLGDEGNRL